MSGRPTRACALIADGSKHRASFARRKLTSRSPPPAGPIAGSGRPRWTGDGEVNRSSLRDRLSRSPDARNVTRSHPVSVQRRAAPSVLVRDGSRGPQLAPHGELGPLASTVAHSRHRRADPGTGVFLHCLASIAAGMMPASADCRLFFRPLTTSPSPCIMASKPCGAAIALPDLIRRSTWRSSNTGPGYSVARSSRAMTLTTSRMRSHNIKDTLRNKPTCPTLR